MCWTCKSRITEKQPYDHYNKGSCRVYGPPLKKQPQRPIQVEQQVHQIQVPEIQVPKIQRPQVRRQPRRQRQVQLREQQVERPQVRRQPRRRRQDQVRQQEQIQQIERQEEIIRIVERIIGPDHFAFEEEIIRRLERFVERMLFFLL